MLELKNEDFWMGCRHAETAGAGTETSVSAAAAGDAAKANQAAANMQGACKQCHGAYREPDAAGRYRIKAATPER